MRVCVKFMTDGSKLVYSDHDLVYIGNSQLASPT